mmetsp:Transcript_13969/g.28246  ORF Transcript_13969/g.28246 Transcript_13969/m.28246 type:complete len:224 (-) Transcript_13969:595-1266(-)
MNPKRFWKLPIVGDMNFTSTSTKELAGMIQRYLIFSSFFSSPLPSSPTSFSSSSSPSGSRRCIENFVIFGLRMSDVSGLRYACTSTGGRGLLVNSCMGPKGSQRKWAAFIVSAPGSMSLLQRSFLKRIQDTLDWRGSGALLLLPLKMEFLMLSMRFFVSLSQVARRSLRIFVNLELISSANNKLETFFSFGICLPSSSRSSSSSSKPGPIPSLRGLGGSISFL